MTFIDPSMTNGSDPVSSDPTGGGGGPSWWQTLLDDLNFGVASSTGPMGTTTTVSAGIGSGTQVARPGQVYTTTGGAGTYGVGGIGGISSGMLLLVLAVVILIVAEK